MDTKSIHKSLVFYVVVLVFGLVVSSLSSVSVKASTSNLIEDPGFETSLSNFEPNQPGTSVSSTSVNPISGTRSLVVGTNGYGDSVLWHGKDISTFSIKKYSQFNSSAKIRATLASASSISFCALVDYASGTDLNNCTQVSGSVGDKGTVVLNFPLDITRNINYVSVGIFQEGSSALSGVLLDDVSVVLVDGSSTTTQTFTVTSSAGTGGIISPVGAVSVTSGNNQTFTITPNTGYQISGVTVDGVSQGILSSYTFFNVTAAHTISATFIQNSQPTYTITASAGNGGSISPSGNITVAAGGTQIFNISTNAGFQIADVLVNGGSVGAVSSYTFTNVNANQTISVSFSSVTPPDGTFQINNQFITGLQKPTASAFAPDGRMFVTEQAGAVRVVTADGQLLPTPFLVTTNMRSDDERGLLGIAVDPNFSSNNYIYIFYTENSAGSRISRFTANGNVVVPGSEMVLLEFYAIGGSHRGGDIHFGPDGKLYIAVGDDGDSANAQSVTTLTGKILRLNSDGTIPADNPTSFVNTSGQTLTPTGTYHAIWAMGLRNPFRFAFNAVTGKMHINDVGEGLWEEVNVGQSGANYGWPACQGFCANAYAQNPIYAYPHNMDEGCAITGGAFYTGNQFPAMYYNDYFFIDYCSTWIRYLKTDNSSSTFPITIPYSVDLKMAPDGSLYAIGYASGTISKIIFVPTNANHNPLAVMSVNPMAGAVPLLVDFSAASSTDPDGDALSYTWNFGDGATGSGAIISHIYNTSSAYTAQLTVSDGKGGVQSVTNVIMVGSPPTATIMTPPEGLLYTAGDTINFSGSASDPDDGVLPASAYSWTVLLHHDTHTHPVIGPVVGVTSSSFTIPTFGHTEENIFYRIYLTVTDSNGLQTTVTRDVLPRKANITITSNIPGTQILLDGSPQITPYTFVGIVGVQRTLGVTSPQTVNGKTYQFSSWSDGGAMSHGISTPSTDTSYIVTMVTPTAPILPTPSLYWKFDNNILESMQNITTVAKGTLKYNTSTAPITATNTASLIFNGASGTYVTTNGNQILNGWNQASISVWIKITSSTAKSWSTNSYHNLLFKYRILQSRILKDATGLKFVVTHSDGTPFGTDVISTSTIPTNTWVNLVSVHQGTTITLYINGQLAGSGSTGKNLGGTSTDAFDIIGHAGNYSGWLDDVRLYTTVFSAAQVQQIPLQ